MNIQLLKNLLPVIIIYGAEWCPACQFQKKITAEQGISYIFKHIESLSDQELKSLGNQIPVLENKKGQRHIGVLAGKDLERFDNGGA